MGDDLGVLTMDDALGRLGELPRTLLAHTPTPIEHLPNLSAQLAGASLYVKRDDCTGLAFGGNKARQLEFYLEVQKLESMPPLRASLFREAYTKGNVENARL